MRTGGTVKRRSQLSRGAAALRRVARGLRRPHFCHGRTEPEYLYQGRIAHTSSDRVYVLKLNNVLKFTTGIYDYSVMTSVFSAVEGFRGTKPFELMKVNLSSQEWCGHIFDEVRVADGGVRGALNSYFEREGLRSYSLDIPEGFPERRPSAHSNPGTQRPRDAGRRIAFDPASAQPLVIPDAGTDPTPLWMRA